MTRPRTRASKVWTNSVKGLFAMAGLLLLLGPVRAHAAFDHTASFSQLPADNFVSRESLYKPSTRWYLDNYDFAKYSGYQDLLEKFDRHLPTGRGLTVLQAENSHTPDAIGDVTHLFDSEASDSHSEKVAGFLSEVDTYPQLYTQYSTFSVDLDSFHTADIIDLLDFFPQMTSVDSYPATDHDNMPITPAKLLNVSNSAGTHSASFVRQLDKFIEQNDMVACTAQSGTGMGNWTTSGMAYNSMVVDQYYGDMENFDGAKLNDHGSPRYKPDVLARSTSAATSYSTPIVCSAAAVLLERASVDAAVANATNSVAVKAILMAGATRFNYRISVEWSDIQEIADPPILGALPLFYYGEWQRTSDAFPTSPKYGAGHLNILTAYDILDAGEFDAGGTEPVGSRGWDYADGLTEADVNTYPITIAQESMFSAILVWHRYIDDDFVSSLPDYAVSVYDSDETRVAHSDSLTANVELVEVQLPAGTYRLEVTVKSDGDSADDLSYGLAWITKEIAPQPQTLTIESLSDSWELSWDVGGAEADYKYRLQVSAAAHFSTLEKDVYLDGATYTYPAPAGEPVRYFRVFTYPQDGEVAYTYPSPPRSIQWPAAPNAPATGQPTISGPTLVGEPLTAVTTDIADANGLGAFRYQWMAHTGTTATAIPGATAATYTLLPADAGKTVTVQVTFTDGDGYEEMLTSRETSQVTAFSLTVSTTTVPEASGRTTVTASTGGATFSAAQTIMLSLSGTATKGVDYLVGSENLTLSASQTIVTTTITAVDDQVVEGGETILVTARLRGRTVGTPLTLTLVDDDQRRPPPPPPPPPGGGSGGGSSGGDQTGSAAVGSLENPGADSFQSGIGVLSGWVCAADTVEIEMETEQGAVMRQAAAYGTERLDTEPVCGDTNNGFGLLFNWNLLDDGEHEVVAYVDDVELGRATVTVTTLGEEFVRDVTGTCTVPDFPMPGETVRVAWQQSQQNFVLAEGAAPSGETRAGIAGVGVLENPGPNSFQSGVGVLSGWVCEADTVEIEITTEGGEVGRQVAGYGTERLDTQDVCGDTDNGFGLLFNWNLLDDGEYAVVAYVDDEELGRATVRVTTLGAEFLRGAEGECAVPDFPLPGETATLRWQQNQQNFVITQVE